MLGRAAAKTAKRPAEFSRNLVEGGDIAKTTKGKGG
jgi:hypothetical protein